MWDCVDVNTNLSETIESMWNYWIYWVYGNLLNLLSLWEPIESIEIYVNLWWWVCFATRNMTPITRQKRCVQNVVDTPLVLPIYKRFWHVVKLRTTCHAKVVGCGAESIEIYRVNLCVCYYDWLLRHVTWRRVRGRSDVPEAWWIRRWYFLYISVSDMLPNFVQRAMRRSWVCGVESIGIYVRLVGNLNL